MSVNAPTGFFILYLLAKPGAAVSGDSRHTAKAYLFSKKCV